MPNRKVSFILSTCLLLLPLVGVVGVALSRQRITPSQNFFSITIDNPPAVNINDWELTITGSVETDLTYNYSELVALPDTEVTATLQCVEGPSGTALWHGVRVKNILETAVLQFGAKEVIFYAADGYSSSLTIEQASEDNILLAYEMNGDDLPVDQGYPLILVATNHLGYKWVKWIYHIEIVDYDYKGYWESRGWNDNGYYSAINDWVLHASLYSITFCIAGFSLISGVNLQPKSDYFKKYPKFVNRKFHIITSVLFTLLAVGLFIQWVIKTWLTRSTVFYSLHGITALISTSLVILSTLSGLKKMRKFKKLTKKHIDLGQYAFWSFLITIIMGFMLAFGMDFLSRSGL